MTAECGVFTHSVADGSWLEDKLMKDRHKMWGLGAFSSFLMASTSMCDWLMYPYV